MDKIIARLKEPSTYAAIAAALVALGVAVPDDVLQAVTQAGAGIAAIAGMVMKEKSAA